MRSHTKPRVAVFASGGGSTFRAVADTIAEELVDFEIVLVITDHEDAGVLQQVAAVNKLYKFSIATAVINKKHFPGQPQGRGQTGEEAAETLRLLKQHNIDHLALMGCLRIIAEQVVESYGWKPEYATQDSKFKGIYLARMSNTHPGILPATGDTHGIHTQESVLAKGLTQTAQTFHVVATGIDTGPTIAEHLVPAFPTSKFPASLSDTPEKLFARVQKIEKANLAFDLDAFLKNQAVFEADVKKQ